ncbi:hypothetical protein KGD15_002817 [Escherichia coli]|nr:hypothetical protein [Escherichia coli]EHM2964193.1 hypothetical protein [Escherichia coli]EHM2978872.1 hypothetical protein [Escherichia coli]EHM2996345.1 hypothetical protein [Escherichia coli]EHM3183403.1 hypothetical protein [Escherichia coli]
MKKTILSLAIFASIGSATAAGWEHSGVGGSISIGGTLEMTDKMVTPWEVKVGENVSDLNYKITAGQQNVQITANKSIPILGIRNTSINGFVGQAGIKPQIDFKDAIAINGFNNGVTTLTLPVKKADGSDVGTLNVPFSSAAVLSWALNQGTGSKAVGAEAPGASFWGGLGKNESQIRRYGSLELIDELDPDFLANFKVRSWDGAAYNEQFANSSATYHAAYGAGIASGSTINIKLTQPATETINWKATLPIVVSYM